MYVTEAIPALMESLEGLSDSKTLILVAHGRNRFAQPSFLEACKGRFAVQTVPAEELDEVFQCSDVDVFRLCKL
jgi:hypothetical protein